MVVASRCENTFVSLARHTHLLIRVPNFIIYPKNCSIQIALVKTFISVLHGVKESSIVLHGSKECSIVLHGSKERRSRQDYFCQVVAMKEESGSHFSLPM